MKIASSEASVSPERLVKADQRKYTWIPSPEARAQRERKLIHVSRDNNDKPSLLPFPIGVGEGGRNDLLFFQQLKVSRFQNSGDVPDPLSGEKGDSSFVAVGHDKLLLCRMHPAANGRKNGSGNFLFTLKGSRFSAFWLAGIQGSQGSKAPLQDDTNRSSPDARHIIAVIAEGKGSTHRCLYLELLNGEP